MMETELSFAKQPFYYRPYYFWIMSYGNCESERSKILKALWQFDFEDNAFQIVRCEPSQGHEWRNGKLWHSLFQLLYIPPNPLITALTESHIAPNSWEEERKSDLAATAFFFSFFLLLLNFSSFFLSSCYSHWVLMAQLTTLSMSVLTLFLSTPGK